MWMMYANSLIKLLLYMGSDLTKENEPDIEKDFQDEYIKYGIISKKCKEQSNDDNYIISSNNNISEL